MTHTAYKIRTQSARQRVTTVLLAFALLLSLALPLTGNAQHVYYRYINKEGVKVLDNSIPPEYAQSGYEVLNASGQVVKVVPPAPSDEEVAKNAAEREAREAYARLSRRYSSADDIESAKKRRLANINTNIAILKGNISNLKNQIHKIMGQAADFERRSQKVPESVLNSLRDTRAELSVAEELLKIRQDEYQEVISKYDDDIAAFVKGKALEEQSQEESQ